MNLKRMAKNYLWPALFAAISAALPVLNAQILGGGVDLEILGYALLAGLLGYVTTRWNPAAGKCESYFVPIAEHEDHLIHPSS